MRTSHTVGKSALFLLLLCAVFAVTFFTAKFGTLGHVSQNETKLRSTQNLTLKNKPFVFLVIGKNNGASVAKTLQSIFAQNYDNFRLIYVDDASTDGSFEFARDIISENSVTNVELVQNETTLGEVANISRCMQSCEREEIAVILSENDWLAHEWVLQRLNAYYEDLDIWMVTGKCVNYPKYQEGKNDGIRSFAVKLCNNIQEIDMASLEQMAENHALFSNEILSVHNGASCGD